MDIKKQNEVFFGKIAGYYDIIFGNWIRKTQIKVIKSSKIDKSSKVLDAGCGTGNFLSLLEKDNIKRLYGIDISKEMLKIAKHKLKISKISLSSVESLKFKSNFFDYIFSVDAFHHYSSKEKAMESFHRVLKSGGKLAVVDLTFGDFLNEIFHRIEPGNSGVCNKIQMRGIFAKYNFKEVKQSKIGMFTVMTAGVK